MTISTRIINVTPKQARTWLEQNTINRPLRPGVVAGHVAAFKRGEYLLTHQGVAFSDTGELLDGQHRLTAMAEMHDGFAIPLMVTYGLPRTAFAGIDQGLKRSHGDVLSIPHSLAACARLLATVHETSKVGITTQFLIPYVKGIRKEYDALVGINASTPKTWASSHIRTAAILRLIDGGDRDYILLSYDALVGMDFSSMSPIIGCLFRQQQRGAIAAKGFDLFCRAYKAFDGRSKHFDRIQITDPSTTLSEVRSLIDDKILGNARPKKIPAAMTGKKKVNNARDSTRVAA